MRARRYQPNVIAVARAALARGKIMRERDGRYRYKRRAFGGDTIEALIAAGHGKRLADGSIVKSESGQ